MGCISLNSPPESDSDGVKTEPLVSSEIIAFSGAPMAHVVVPQALSASPYLLNYHKFPPSEPEPLVCSAADDLIALETLMNTQFSLDKLAGFTSKAQLDVIVNTAYLNFKTKFSDWFDPLYLSSIRLTNPASEQIQPNPEECSNEPPPPPPEEPDGVFCTPWNIMCTIGTLSSYVINIYSSLIRCDNISGKTAVYIKDSLIGPSFIKSKYIALEDSSVTANINSTYFTFVLGAQGSYRLDGTVNTILIASNYNGILKAKKEIILSGGLADACNFQTPTFFAYNSTLKGCEINLTSNPARLTAGLGDTLIDKSEKDESLWPWKRFPNAWGRVDVASPLRSSVGRAGGILRDRERSDNYGLASGVFLHGGGGDRVTINSSHDGVGLVDYKMSNSRISTPDSITVKGEISFTDSNLDTNYIYLNTDLDGTSKNLFKIDGSSQVELESRVHPDNKCYELTYQQLEGTTIFNSYDQFSNYDQLEGGLMQYKAPTVFYSSTRGIDVGGRLEIEKSLLTKQQYGADSVCYQVSRIRVAGTGELQVKGTGWLEDAGIDNFNFAEIKEIYRAEPRYYRNFAPIPINNHDSSTLLCDLIHHEYKPGLEFNISNSGILAGLKYGETDWSDPDIEASDKEGIKIHASGSRYIIKNAPVLTNNHDGEIYIQEMFATGCFVQTEGAILKGRDINLSNVYRRTQLRPGMDDLNISHMKDKEIVLYDCNLENTTLSPEEARLYNIAMLGGAALRSRLDQEITGSKILFSGYLVYFGGSLYAYNSSNLYNVSNVSFDCGLNEGTVNNASFKNSSVARRDQHSCVFEDSYVSNNLYQSAKLDNCSHAGWPYSLYLWECDPEINGGNFTYNSIESKGIFLINNQTTIRAASEVEARIQYGNNPANPPITSIVPVLEGADYDTIIPSGSKFSIRDDIFPSIDGTSTEIRSSSSVMPYANLHGKITLKDGVSQIIGCNILSKCNIANDLLSIDYSKGQVDQCYVSDTFTSIDVTISNTHFKLDKHKPDASKDQIVADITITESWAIVFATRQQNNDIIPFEEIVLASWTTDQIKEYLEELYPNNFIEIIRIAYAYDVYKCEFEDPVIANNSSMSYCTFTTQTHLLSNGSLTFTGCNFSDSVFDYKKISMESTKVYNGNITNSTLEATADCYIKMNDSFFYTPDGFEPLTYSINGCSIYDTSNLIVERSSLKNSHVSSSNIKFTNYTALNLVTLSNSELEFSACNIMSCNFYGCTIDATDPTGVPVTFRDCTFTSCTIKATSTTRFINPTFENTTIAGNPIII